MTNHRDYIHILAVVAEAFRQSDKYFPYLPIEDKSMLNDVGKMLEDIEYLLSKYYRSEEDEQLGIRNVIHTLRLKVERVLKESKDEIQEG